MDNNLAISYKHHHLLYDREISFLGIYSREGKYPHKNLDTNVCSSFIHSNSKLKLTHQHENGQTDCSVLIQWNMPQQ